MRIDHPVELSGITAGAEGVAATQAFYGDTSGMRVTDYSGDAWKPEMRMAMTALPEPGFHVGV